ncbi:MAG: electron transfer flavoprotein subunit alpha/FixB family protein [Anaerolineales bacterium]
MKTLVYIDHFKGDVQPASWEALGLAKSLGTASAVVFGAGVDAVAKAAFEHGADEVFVADDAVLTDYRSEPYAATLSVLASSQSPDLILFPTTARTRELSAMSAVDLNTGVLTDITGLEANGDQLVATRPIYEGKVLEKTVCSGKPVMATVRGRAFPKPEADTSKSGTATKVEVKSDALTTVEGYSQSESAVNLGDAGVIVSGGRGVSNNPSLVPPAGLDDKQAEIWRAQQGFALVTELANVLGGAVGASRAAVERRIHSVFPPGRADRQSRYSRSVHRLRHFRRDPAFSRHEECEGDRGDQQGCRCPHLQTGALWCGW